MFWSMIANVGGYVLASLFSRQDMIERVQASGFVDVFRRPPGEAEIWRRSAAVDDLYALLQRFIGPERAARSFRDYTSMRGENLGDRSQADAELVSFVERLLAAASALPLLALWWPP